MCWLRWICAEVFGGGWVVWLAPNRLSATSGYAEVVFGLVLGVVLVGGVVGWRQLGRSCPAAKGGALGVGALADDSCYQRYNG